MIVKEIPCSPKNRGGKRDRKNVKFIVIHYTAGKGDTAEAEGRYFQTAGRKASAHFFIGQDGHVVKSVPLNYVAWSVGGSRYIDYLSTGGAKWYGTCTNSSSVSIELCDNRDKDPSNTQITSLCKVIKYIRKHCPNIVSGAQIIRHFDVTGKYCPKRMCEPYGDSKKWYELKTKIVLECFK